ncbi:hypothetical protein LZ24_00055 [Desulfobotulus alkaliphilus]|uniref:Uncharacterized protein n=1 Tax=Desulfobotulus alkaliphilus TaxID=622671 RepID=A0A562S772_9BACT|nr:hypothetical protein [Desulfobotulus alkaliphilus]TWI77255.1 hypothetical protein LZ24_00055 [Desulfobotulus alkaliphilus]
MEVLYFPFLNVNALSTGCIRSFAPRVQILQGLESALFSPTLKAMEEGWLVPVKPAGLDLDLLSAMAASLEERAGFLGKEGLTDFFSEKEETIPDPLLLVREIRGKLPLGSAVEKRDEALAMAAFFLMKAEAFDREKQELEEDFRRVTSAGRDMLAGLMGESSGGMPVGEAAFPVPCRLEERIRFWLRLFLACEQAPFFWVTDMPGAEEILEGIFSGAIDEMDELPEDGPVLPGNVKGVLLRVSLAKAFPGEKKALHFPEFLWIFCLDIPAMMG